MMLKQHLPITKQQNFGCHTKFKAFADDILKVAKMMISFFDRVENTGKRRKCWLQAFSLLPTVFSKALFFRVVKSRDRVVKSQTP